MNQKLAHHTITSIGGEVTMCAHGKEALDAVVAAGDEDHFDVILMDHLMPVMDGTEATKVIRKLEAAGKFKRNIIIGLSATVGPEFMSEIYSAGMDGHLSKPFLPKILRDLLSSIYLGEFVRSRKSFEMEPRRKSFDQSSHPAHQQAAGGA